MKVPFFRSIRLRILLLALIPMLFCILSIEILTGTSLQTTSGMRTIVDQQAELYQSLTLPATLCERLSDYLSTGDGSALEDYRMVEAELQTFVQQLQTGFEGYPYCESLARLGTHLIDAANGAVAWMHDDAQMLSCLQESSRIRVLISDFSPYVTRELQTASTERIELLMTRVANSVRSDVLIFAAMLLALVVTTALLASSIIHPLTALTRAVQNMSISHDGAVLSRTRRKDEIGILLRAYQDMVKRIRLQLNELEDKRNVERMLQQEREKTLEAESLLARSELKVYQSQINSHFLFNSFNTVSRLAYMENAPQVQHAVALIAQFLRNILTQFNRNITVEEEFSIVDNFVEIQNLRFGDRIKVESSLDVGAEWFVIPSMTMQPLVENAYRHGLADRKEGYIRYVAETDGGDLKLYAWDDGKGMSDEQARALRRYIVEGDDDGLAQDGIGLRNVYRRLSLMYPDRVEPLIDCAEGMYAQIGFRIRMDED